MSRVCLLSFLCTSAALPLAVVIHIITLVATITVFRCIVTCHQDTHTQS